MKLFFTHKEIALKKKRTALVVIGIGLVIGIYLIVSHQPAKMPELPVVAIAPATQDDVEIYGEYVIIRKKDSDAEGIICRKECVKHQKIYIPEESIFLMKSD